MSCEIDVNAKLNGETKTPDSSKCLTSAKNPIFPVKFVRSAVVPSSGARNGQIVGMKSNIAPIAVAAANPNRILDCSPPHPSCFALSGTLTGERLAIAFKF